MNIYIGENIKRLRQQRGITQEKFAEYVKVSAPAVSKWERGETLPDITLILPIANFFEVSTDELLGYDKTKVGEDIKSVLEKYYKAMKKSKFSEAEETIKAAHVKYPNDFRITMRYVHLLLGVTVENYNSETVLKNAEQCIPLCERVIAECTDIGNQLGARQAMAMIYNAKGDSNKALSYFENCPSFYLGKEQLIEQIFPRGSEEWRKRIFPNMIELTDFAMTKIVRVIWWGMDRPIEEKMQLIDDLVESVEKFTAKAGFDFGSQVLGTIYCDSGIYCNGKEELHHLAVKYFGKWLECSNANVAWCKSTASLIKLRERADFQEILARYE